MTAASRDGLGSEWRLEAWWTEAGPLPEEDSGKDLKRSGSSSQQLVGLLSFPHWDAALGAESAELALECSVHGSSSLLVSAIFGSTGGSETRPNLLLTMLVWPPVSHAGVRNPGRDGF